MKIDDKLADKPEINDFMLHMAKAGLLKFGKLSVPYLMRKLNISVSTAKEILEIMRRAT